MTNNSIAAVRDLPRRSGVSIALKTGGLPPRSGTVHAPHSQHSGNASRTPSTDDSMGKVLEEAYRHSPDLRAQVEHEAHLAQAREVDRLMVTPVRRWLKHPTLGHLGTVVIGGLLVASVASCGSGGSDAGIVAVAPISAEAEKTASRPTLLQQLDHAVVNRSSTAHESDLNGASVAAYGM